MTRVYVTWLISACHDSLTWDLNHLYVTIVLYGLFVCNMTRFYLTCVHVKAMKYHSWHNSLACDMNHLYVTSVLHDTFVCDMTRLYVTWHVSLRHVCVYRQRNTIRDRTHTHETWIIYMRQVFCMTRVCVTWLDLCVCDMTRHVCVWHDTFLCDMTRFYETCVCVQAMNYHSWQNSHSWDMNQSCLISDLENIVSFIRLLCKRDLCFEGAY